MANSLRELIEPKLAALDAQDLYYAAMNMMERTGGGFASALATAWKKADNDNKNKIKEAFPDLINEFKERVLLVRKNQQ